VIVFHVLLKPGDEFVASRKLYGGSINQFTMRSRTLAGMWCGPTRRYLDVRTRGVTKTKAIFNESIANRAASSPTLRRSPTLPSAPPCR